MNVIRQRGIAEAATKFYSQFLVVESKKINFKDSKWNGSIEIEPNSSFPAFSIAAHNDGYVSCNESEQTVYIQMSSENEIGQWSIITPEEFIKFYEGFNSISALAKTVLNV